MKRPPPTHAGWMGGVVLPLIKHAVDIVHDMGTVTVAEGIEPQAYADYLKKIGCDDI